MKTASHRKAPDNPKKSVKPGTLFLFIGPSQVGKDTILKAILKKQSLGLKRVVTVTTRQPRPGETNGISYIFVDDATFDAMIKRGEFFEWVRVQTHRSGSPKHPTLELLARGQNLILHIDVHGADTLAKQKGLNTVSIFIAPRSLAELKRRFMKKRFSEQERRVRWQTTLAEMKRVADFDFRVVNEEGHIRETVREVEEIINAVR